MKEQMQELTDKKIEAAQMMVQGIDKTKIAENVGVSRATIYNWMKQDDFNMEVDRLRQELKTLGMSVMTGKLDKAITEYWHLIQNTDSDRVKAEGYRYFIDHNLGKATTKLELDPGFNKDDVPERDILEDEFAEYEETEQ